MDGLLSDLDLITATPSFDTDEEQSHEPEQGSADFYKKQFEESQKAHREAMQKISELGQQNAQTTALMQQMLVMQQQQIQGGQAPQGAAASNDWTNHYASLTGQDAQQGVYLDPNQVAEMATHIADQRISATLQGMHQERQAGDALYQRFLANEKDLHGHADVVAEFFHSRPDLPYEQRYQFAVQKTRQLSQAGRLSKPMAAPGFAGLPSGGQNGGMWASPQSGGRQGGQRHQTMAEMKKDLDEWVTDRKNRQEDAMRMGFTPAARR